MMMYASRRFLRTGSIHGLSRFSSLMNTVYRRHLGDEPYGFYPAPVKKFWLPQHTIAITWRRRATRCSSAPSSIS